MPYCGCFQPDGRINPRKGCQIIRTNARRILRRLSIHYGLEATVILCSALSKKFSQDQHICVGCLEQ